MLKSLSRSTKVMFVFDLLVFSGVTSAVLNYSLNENCNLFIKICALSLVVATGLFSLMLKSNYAIQRFDITTDNIFRLFEGVFFAHIPTIVLLFFFIYKTALINFVLINILSVFSCLFLYRFCFHFYLFNIKKAKKVLIIGANERAKVITEVLKNKPALRMEVVGIVKIAENKNEMTEYFSDGEYPIIETKKEIFSGIDKNNIDIILFTHKSSIIPSIPTNIKTYLMTDFYEMATGKFYIDQENISEFAYEFHKNPRKIYNILKRILDIICALIILIVTLPITAYVALRVLLTDKGNPFFSQTRVSKNGKTFECYKLRTMYKNDFSPKNEYDVRFAELHTDDKIIPFCKFVRKARFDEIPQMLNILSGEISIVGPRAEWADLAEIYKKQIFGYEYRTVVNTAWTGWAQINQGHCSSTNAIAEKLQYDLYYIKHRNIFWEICILVKAVFLALGGRHK